MPFLPVAADLQPIPDVRQVAPASQRAAAPLFAQAPQGGPSSSAPPEKRALSYPYMSYAVGVGLPKLINSSLDSGPPLGTIGNQFGFNPGFAGEIAAGYRFPRTRLELAVGYGSFDRNQQTVTVQGEALQIPATGAMSYVSVLVNGYYDIPIRKSDGSDSPWRPYIGAGLGYASVSTPACVGEGCFQGGRAGAFAYQGKVGIAYRLATTSDMFVEGSYLGTTGFTVDTLSYDNIGAFRVTVGWRRRL